MAETHRRRIIIGDDGPFHVTADGLAKLKEKLTRLENSLPSLIAETQRTAAYGDRSENAEYQAAKGALRRANFQIIKVQDQIRRAKVFDSGPSNLGTIRLGSKVALEFEGREINFEIVGPHETNPERGRISFESPLGAALLHRKKNDVVMLETAVGQKQYRILAIR